MSYARRFVPGVRFERRLIPAIVIGFLDVFAIGFGMGVPIFAVLLGFPVGWWLARRYAPSGPDPRAARAALTWAALLAGASFAVLLLVWGPHLPKAFDPAFDAAEWGIPLILYTSQASIIGWFVLMLVIGPMLQAMAVLTGAMAAFAVAPKTPAEPRKTEATLNKRAAQERSASVG